MRPFKARNLSLTLDLTTAGLTKIFRIIIIPNHQIIMRARKETARNTRRISGLTRQRTVVLDVVRAREHHPTAAEIFEAARKKMPGTVALTRSAARAAGFKAESVHLTLVGLCPDCRDVK